jgi:hypothetical protein
MKLVVLAILVGLGTQLPAAWAQDGSVKAIFEKHGLIGTFAWDCSKPASEGNRYYVHRALDANRVQRDEMTSQTERKWFIVLDAAKELKPNEITLGGLMTGMAASPQRTDGIWQLEPNRIRIVEATLAGRKVVSQGRLVSNGREMPLMNRCR